MPNMEKCKIHSSWKEPYFAVRCVHIGNQEVVEMATVIPNRHFIDHVMHPTDDTGELIAQSNYVLEEEGPEMPDGLN